LSENIYTDTEAKVPSVDKDAVYSNPNSDGSNNVQFGLLTVNSQSNDSLRINIELLKVTKNSDKLRIANFGGRPIPKDQNAINNIKSICADF
jgi:hypothetical protein